jgi:hypothetical protein
MVERGERLCLACKARQAIRISRERCRQDLDRGVAIQPRVARAIDLAHAAGANRRQDFVRADERTGL